MVASENNRDFRVSRGNKVKGSIQYLNGNVAKLHALAFLSNTCQKAGLGDIKSVCACVDPAVTISYEKSIEPLQYLNSDF